MTGALHDIGELIEECLRGGRDTEAWAEFERRTRPVLAAVAGRTAYRCGCGSPDVVQDLTQDAFLKLCRSDYELLKQVRGKPANSIVAFLKVVTANIVYDYFRAESGPQRRPEGGWVSTDSLDSVAEDRCTEQALARKLVVDEIDAVLRADLTGAAGARDRQIFWLKHRHGMTAKAIAAIPAFRLTESGVEASLCRALRILRRKWAITQEFVRENRPYEGVDGTGR